MTERPAPSTPVTPVASATLLLLRDSDDGLQVLMTTRHAEAGFASGALVFPGGKVNPDDERLAAGNLDSDPATLPRRIAAIRETHEECGILLARRPGRRDLLSPETIRQLRGSHGADLSFATLVDRGAIEIATDLLVVFAHWITPHGRPRRFDTHFFLAPAPEGQVARHDGREAVDARWISPHAALRDADAGLISMVFATRMNLAKLGRSRTVADALAAARASTVVTVCPERAQGPSGPVFRIPAAADYGTAEVPIGNIPMA